MKGMFSSSAPKIAPHANSAPLKTGAVSTKKHDLSLCTGLVSMFDFDSTGSVNRENWQRGMKGLDMQELGDDGSLWRRMLEMHSGKGDGYIELERVKVRSAVPILSGPSRD